MHIQQPQCHKHGQTAGEDTGTAWQVLEDIPACVVRCATPEATSMATDNPATRVLPENTRGQHQVHAG